MKNYIASCCVFRTKSDAKFIDPDGNQRRIEVPSIAAELMLESPGYIVVPVEDLRRTWWIYAMKADEELQGGKTYMMFPAKRMNCKASNGEMMAVDDATCGKKARSQVHPMEEIKREEVSQYDDAEERESCFPVQRPSNYRQWRPVLETINEGT